MDQREILRRLCNGALAAQVLSESNPGSSSSTNNSESNNESILNTLLVNVVGSLILKRRTNKSTQTDFNVQRISKCLIEPHHLLPLNKLPQKPICIRYKNEFYQVPLKYIM